MINLWKDEYIRRKRLKIPTPLPDVFKISEEELQGESIKTFRKSIPHDQLKHIDKIKDIIVKNLRTCIENENDLNQDCFVDKPDNNPIGDFRIDEKEASNRWGHNFFKELKHNREKWANEGPGLNDIEFAELQKESLDTLDIMGSMKNQYAEMYKKPSTMSLRKKMLAKDNTKITDFYNRNLSKTPNLHTEAIEEDSQLNMSNIDQLEFSIK